MRAPLVADQQAGHHHGDRRGDAERLGTAVAARRHRERDQDLHRIVVDGMQHEVRAVAERGADQQAPAD
jgi:hypothetical protein